MSANNPEHLFISYAWEDGAIAEWLTRKLTAEGYRVWCDRFKLLGGESYPKDIDAAIKGQTFRVLALLSRHSISKDNPVKERTLALNIGKERKIDFLIPLNADGLKATELDWMTNDLTFIPFHGSWATGLQQLLKKLDSINAPRPLKNGREIAAATFLPDDLLQAAPEPLSSNCLKFEKIPSTLRRFRFNKELTKEMVDKLSRTWAFYKTGKSTVLAFDDPPTNMGDNLTVATAGSERWLTQENVDGISSVNLVSSLIFKSLRVKCVSKGLCLTTKGRLYFPWGLLDKNTIMFVDYNGKKTRVLATGERTARSASKGTTKYRYHLSPEFGITRRLDPPFTAQIRPRLVITDLNGQELPRRSAVARRKRIGKSWWNHQWLNRVLAICQFLADGGEKIVIGRSAEGEIVLSAKPIVYEAPLSIKESALNKVEKAEVDEEVDEIGEDDEEQLEEVPVHA